MSENFVDDATKAKQTKSKTIRFNLSFENSSYFIKYI